MARPERNNVDYFPFICEDGNKMFYIEETYGNDGFAVFVKLLRELAKTDYHYLDLSKPTTIMFLSAKCKVNKELLLLIINDLVEIGKFDSVLWKENSIIWCESFIESIKDAYIKRNNKCITYEGLLLLLISLGIRKPSKLSLKGDEKPQSIVKDSKVNKTKENNIPIYEDFLLYAKEQKPLIDEYSVKAKYETWIDNDWKDGNGNEIKNWKSKLKNTLPYLKENNNLKPKTDERITELATLARLGIIKPNDSNGYNGGL